MTKKSHEIEEMFMTLDEAQEKFIEAIDMIESVVGSDPNIKAYWIGHARILASNDHGYVSRDMNIDDIKERVENDPEKFLK